jgi:copper(I)-binding protein
MTVTSSEDAKIVEARSPIAQSTEIHQSTLKDGVNHMHPVDTVALPAGKAVELKPGGYHMMLMGIAKPVTAGAKVPIELTIEDRKGKRSKVQVQADVKALGQ